MKKYFNFIIVLILIVFSGCSGNDNENQNAKKIKNTKTAIAKKTPEEIVFEKIPASISDLKVTLGDGWLPPKSSKMNTITSDLGKNPFVSTLSFSAEAIKWDKSIDDLVDGYIAGEKKLRNGFAVEAQSDFKIDNQNAKRLIVSYPMGKTRFSVDVLCLLNENVGYIAKIVLKDKSKRQQYVQEIDKIFSELKIENTKEAIVE